MISFSITQCTRSTIEAGTSVLAAQTRLKVVALRRSLGIDLRDLAGTQVTTAINPPLAGRILLGDAEWTAEADEPIAAGANVKVVAQNNLTMRVEKV